MRLGALLFLFAAVSIAQVQNAADAAAGGYANSPIAPGALAFITDFASSASPAVNGAAVSIRPVGSSTAIRAQVVDTSLQGITFLVPADVPLGNAQLIYHQAGELTQYTTVSISANNFSLYRNPARGTNVDATGKASPNGLATPAQPGEAVEIFGTGLSTVPQTPPQVTAGGVAQKVLYSGAAPGNPGVLQINLQIAPATPDGCYLPLTVTWGPSTATSYLSKTSDGMPCHHPFGLSTAALQTLDSGGSLQVGMTAMTTALTAASAQVASRQESATVTFSSLSASNLAARFTANAGQGCSILSLASAGSFLEGAFGYNLAGTITLQSGSTILTLTSSQSPGYSASILPSPDTPLTALSPPVIGAGKWTWTASGASGSGLPTQSFDFNLPPPVQLSGGAPISLKSGQDQTINWNGGGFDAGALLQLSLTTPGIGVPTLQCFAPAQAGSVIIPGSLLQQFPSGHVGTLSVQVTESGSFIPHAAVNSPSGQELMLVNWTSRDSRPVDFQ
ncbi:MAG TPA: hypothetical protein VK789_26850 [Bryobacteraceae bacterium]|nr:hypothetical protein [Bryobacteraceae bacterium]